MYKGGIEEFKVHYPVSTLTNKSRSKYFWIAYFCCTTTTA